MVIKSKERHLSQLKESDQQENETSLWVQSALSGSIKSFEKLYQKYHRRVYLYAKRMTGSIEEAEEVVQDTFVKTWQNLNSFRAESKFYTWVRRIASRIMIDRLRIKNAKVWQESTEYEDVYPVAHVNAGEQRDLEKMVAQLPEGARNIFVMHDIEGYSHNEISEMAGVAVGTSKAQLFRARKLLRTRL